MHLNQTVNSFTEIKTVYWSAEPKSRNILSCITYWIVTWCQSPCFWRIILHVSWWSICFVCEGRMLLNDSKKGPPHVQYRRPYGCAALAMSDVFSSITDPKEEKDFVLKIYTWVCSSVCMGVCAIVRSVLICLIFVYLLCFFFFSCNNESEWYQIHENIIRKSSTKYSAPSTNYGNLREILNANVIYWRCAPT